eukprot:evm.model.scf_257.2 EVM.evm.TU.scf_257.2   scf_257:34929-36316(+)
MPAALRRHSSIGHRRGRKNKRTNSGKKRSNAHRAAGKRAAASAQKASPHESPRIRAVYVADEAEVVDFGLQRLFKEEREAAASLIHDDKAYMGLSVLFDEGRDDGESIGLADLLEEAGDADVAYWAVDFGLAALFEEGGDKKSTMRSWTDVAWVALAGAAVAVPLAIWALRGCRSLKRGLTG